ncbi:hypothetical protein [Roseovarius dicentrarchi]|uniref:hypothetical protein n=1 Tax=Roseovarius dicentrarchi TaxID=2250573 RepID=UPI000DE99DA3|nr:hypothetical protein [Roseovarius dicentrarchi]
MPAPIEKKLRIPVRLVDGKWEVEFGGQVPVKDDQTAEILVPEKAITDKLFLEEMKKRVLLSVLPRGSKLRAYLATKDFENVSEEQRKALIDWENWHQEVSELAIDNWSGGALSFFELELGPATDRQMQDDDLMQGGLWLEIKGRKATGLISSTFELPPCVSDEPARSLNHAFTILSEVYEPWRISHTGSAYERFLYQEGDGADFKNTGQRLR